VVLLDKGDGRLGGEPAGIGLGHVGGKTGQCGLVQALKGTAVPVEELPGNGRDPQGPHVGGVA